jgi:hypothetical protein
MTFVRQWLFGTVVLLMLADTSAAENIEPRCKGTTLTVVGECFRFRGRLGLFNGGHTFWIWRVGTNHEYWVEGELPAGVEESLDWEHFYWGAFEACPTTKFEKGHAQGICVIGVEKLSKTNRTK